MNKQIRILQASALIIFLLLWSSKLNAQHDLPDGTLATQAYLSELQNNLLQENALKFDTSAIDLSVNLSVAIYIIRDSSGNLGIIQSLIQPVIDEVNKYFKQIGVNFIAKTVTNVDDYHYSYFSIYTRPKELLLKHSVEKTINLYLVDSLSKDSVSYYGFTYFPTDTQNNYIFLRKEYFSAGYLTCMLGHFLGLLSTHDKLAGIEFADESNCFAKGDLICDTYADPDILNKVDTSCLYKGEFRDPIGKYFIPSVANFMSNSPGKCRCIFTRQQYRRMYFYYKKFRQYLR